jgi:hypothetical protein
MVTVLLLDGLKVTGADALTVVNVTPSVPARTDRVWSRAPHPAGSCRTIRLALCAEPRSTWTHWGKALLALSQWVFWSASAVLADPKPWVWLDSLVGLPAARLVLTAPVPGRRRAGGG